MLGQEDTAADKPSDNPRAFGNKPVWKRAIVIAAGVTMNIIAAAITFVIVFAHGVALPPAVVGDVVEGMPAFNAGIQPGDEIIGINDMQDDLSYTDLIITGAFADKGQKVPLTVRHLDGTIETFGVEPEKNEKLGMRLFGINSATTLTIDQPIDPEVTAELEKLGLRPGDEIVALNGKDVTYSHEYQSVLFPKGDAEAPSPVTLTVSRLDSAGSVTRHDITVTMSIMLPFMLEVCRSVEIESG